MMKRNILITGGAGFVPSSLAERLAMNDDNELCCWIILRRERLRTFPNVETVVSSNVM